MMQHPHEHDNVDTTGLRDHDDPETVDQFDCVGCFDRIVEMIREAELPYQVEDGRGGWKLVEQKADPKGYPKRWLREWKRRHPW